jgi:hypothetical protein
MATVHVRVQGRSEDLQFEELGLRMLSSLSNGEANNVKKAVARHLRVHEDALNQCKVDLHPSGNLTVRPQAVYG